MHQYQFKYGIIINTHNKWRMYCVFQTELAYYILSLIAKKISRLASNKGYCHN